MSRLSRIGSDNIPVYFPSVVSKGGPRKNGPVSPIKSKHPKRHPHHTDYQRVHLEPLKTEKIGNTLAFIPSTERLLNPHVWESSSSSENTSLLHEMQLNLKFYKLLASFKLRSVVSNEETFLKTIDSILLHTCTALNADWMILYSLEDDGKTLSVAASTKPGIHGFTIPIEKFAMEAVLAPITPRGGVGASNTASVDDAGYGPVYVRNLQQLSSYEVQFDVDSRANFKTSSVLGGTILDENGKPTFLVEVRSSREETFSNSIFSAAMTALENIVYQYDFKQVWTKAYENYSYMDELLMSAMALVPTSNHLDDAHHHSQHQTNKNCLASATAGSPMATSRSFTIGDDDEEDEALAEIIAPNAELHLFAAPDMTQIIQKIVTYSNADTALLLNISSNNERKGRDGISVSVIATSTTTASQDLLDLEKLSNLPTSSKLVERLDICIKHGCHMDLSEDPEFGIYLKDKSLCRMVFFPLPCTSTHHIIQRGSGSLGLLCMSKHDNYSYDLRYMKPLLSTLALASVIIKQNEDMMLSSHQKKKLIALFKSHYAMDNIHDPSTLVNMICNIGSDIFNTKRVTLYVADPIKNELWSLSTLGTVNGLRIPYGTGICGTVAAKKETLVVRDPYNDPRFDSSFDVQFGFKTKSLITFPILDHNDEVLGVIQAVNSQNFMENSSAIIKLYDRKVMDLYKHLVSHALRINSSLIMFAKVQADYLANRAGTNTAEDVNVELAASVHSLLDTSGFDESKRLPRSIWNTLPFACLALGKLRRNRKLALKRQAKTAQLTAKVAAEVVAATNGAAAEGSDTSTSNKLDPVESLRVVRGNAGGHSNSLLLAKWGRPSDHFTSKEEELSSDSFDVFTKTHDDLLDYAYRLYDGLNLIGTFRLQEASLRKFLATLASRYRNVPYHNFLHGFDVAHTCFRLIRFTSVLQVIKEIEALSLITAGLGHDADHPGNDNQFEIDSSSGLALCYNDISVLENHHAATTFSVLRSEGCDFLKDLSTVARSSIRGMIVRSILATDMRHHTKLLNEIGEIRHISQFETITDGRQVMLNMMIHGADLGNSTKPLQLAFKWADRICTEFTDQAKKCKELGIPVPAHICNLEDDSVRARLQVNFIDYLVVPLWNSIVGILPEARRAQENLRITREYYFEKAGQASGRHPSGPNAGTDTGHTKYTTATTTSESSPSTTTDTAAGASDSFASTDGHTRN